MATSSRKRLHFVDVLRLIALLQMVNGHTLNAVLREDLRHGSLYSGYLWFRGLVSVAFMLVAGLAFYLTTVMRPEARTPAERRRRVARAVEIIAIGFLLRLPLSSLLAGDSRAFVAGLASLARIDVLPCIGVSLLMLEGLLALVSARRHLMIASGAICLATAFLSGWGATLPTQFPLGLLTGWLGPQGGSAFPLLPYSGYVFAGALLGGLALPLGAATPQPRAAGMFAATAAGLWGLSLAFEQLPHAVLGARGPLVHTPAFFTLKLAVVALVCGALAFALRGVEKLPKNVAALAGETLAVYVFHLFVLYGWPFGLARRIGTTLSLPAALGVSAGMLVASLSVGLLWRHAKNRPPARELWPRVRASMLLRRRAEVSRAE